MAGSYDSALTEAVDLALLLEDDSLESVVDLFDDDDDDDFMLSDLAAAGFCEGFFG